MKLQGAFTALVTPMCRGEVYLDGLRELVEHQITAGIDGLVPVGTTGEAATLTADERFKVIQTVAQVAAGRVPVIAGAGANSTAAAVEGSKLAAEAGADALLHVTPYYNKPTQDGLLAHFAAVAEATDLPVVLYNVPGRTSCDMLPATVGKAASIKNVVGIKEATGCLHRASRVLAAVPDNFAVLSGDDFTCMPFCVLGGRGVISVVSNLVPSETAKMIRAAREGDLVRARELHYSLLPLMELLFCQANPIPVKAGMALLGFTDNELRLPLLPLEGDELEALATQLRQLGRLGA